MVKVQIEVQINLLVVIGIIHINLVADVMVIMVLPMEAMMALQAINTGLVQTAPNPQNLKESVDITDIQNNMNFSGRV